MVRNNTLAALEISNKTGWLFKGSKADGVAAVIGTQYEDGLNPLILKDRKAARYQKLSKSANKDNFDMRDFNIPKTFDKKQAYVPLCSMGFVPFCISSSQISITKHIFRVNYCMYYDNEVCIAAISEGFGPFANDLSFICCRQAVINLMGKSFEVGQGRLSEIIHQSLAEVESTIEDIEEKHKEELDTLMSGASLAILIIYKGQIASGILGDALLVKLEQNIDGGPIKYKPINIGLPMTSAEERERIYWSQGEIRKNYFGKECIYVKGREYPEAPMMSCIGCRIGKQVGIISDHFLNQESHNKLFDRQGILLLCNREFYTRIAEDEENLKLFSCMNLSDAHSIREYIYGKLKIQYLQKGNPIDDCIGLIFIMDKEVGTAQSPRM